MEMLLDLYEQANTILTDNFGDLGPLLVVGVLGVFLILLTLPIVLRKEKDPLDKIREATQQIEVGDDKAKLRRGKQGKDKLAKYSNFLEPQNEEEYSAVRVKLLQAGYRSKDAVRTYHFLQFALGILGLFLRIVREENMTVLMASHDSLVDDYVDTILQLRDGQIMEIIEMR